MITSRMLPKEQPNEYGDRVAAAESARVEQIAKRMVERLRAGPVDADSFEGELRREATETMFIAAMKIAGVYIQSGPGAPAVYKLIPGRGVTK